ncbi:uncharacterized protein LOC132862482 [Tachysurus vachellii]|uniref:uncharacterized protein LOC132862482 n=1 Tax=Tachysurus vachellii TaxID=175792 RepID=UPI00296AE8A9|nr:uncharacterized protein LOC132862482 [Tachysurus vachellii]
MMKILLIFTLSLISGPVGCVMTGYTGGSIVIISDLKWGSGFSTYICKKGSISCTDIIRTDTTENSVQEGRFKLYKNSNRFLRVLIRRLKPQDTGVYRIGVEDQTPTDLELTVLNDSCCDRPKTVNVFPGQNISIISNYPVIYNRDFKYIMKLENGSVFYAILDTLEKSQNNRFSIFDDSIAKVLGMNISNVTEADDGVYLYGIFNRKNSIQYYSFFREIHLHVKGCWAAVSLSLYAINPIISHFYAPSVHENNLPNLPTYENLKIKIRSNEQNLGSSTNQSDSTYQTLDPLTNQSDSSYMSLSNTADQSHSHYQCLNARTQMNSVYQTLHS